MIGAIILAAGESRRMGKPKLLLPYGERTIIETVVSNLIQSEAEEILVVLGSDAEKVKKKIKGLPVKTTINPNYREGMLSSLQWGFQNVSANIQAVLVVLGDQPGISAAVVNEVIKAYKETGKGIAIPTYKNERGHPVLIEIKYRKEVENLNPDIGLRQLVYNHPEDTTEVEVGSASILRDIDNLEDYREELKNK